jgi:PPP family 3-phenylpropionic acid transporter
MQPALSAKPAAMSRAPPRAAGVRVRESRASCGVRVSSLSAVYFWYFAFIGLFAPYFGLFLQSLGQSAFEIGVLLSVMQLARVLAPHGWAVLADRLGRRVRLLRITLALSALFAAGFLLAEGFWTLFAVVAALGLVSSASMPLVEATTLARLEGRMAGYGAVRLWGSVGFVVAVLAGGWALDRTPIDILPWLFVATILATLAATAGVGEARSPAGREHAALGPVVRRREVAVLMAACFLMSVAHGPLYSFFSIYADAAGYDKTTIGVLWTLGVVAEIAVFATLPRWLPHASMERILAVSFALAVARFVMIGWAVEHLAVLVVAQLLHGATFGSYHVAALAVVHRWFDGSRQVRGQALYTALSYGAGGFLGSLASGALWEAVGPAWTFTAGAAAAASGFALLVHQGRLMPSHSPAAH